MSVGAVALLAGGCMFILWGRGGKLYPLRPLFLEEFASDQCPSRTCSEISKQLSLLYAPVVFHTAASALHFHGAICCVVSLRVGSSE